MKIYDISQELFTCQVYPGDLSPSKDQVEKIKSGASCNLTNLTMCAHNGTHIDAPYHFYENGKTIDRLDLQKVIGPAQVIAHDGSLTEADVERLLSPQTRRVLFKGKAVITLDAAKALNRRHVDLIGVESQTVGPEDAPMEVHLELLGQEVILLEGIRLGEVSEGTYFLNAAPINLGGTDGAPCRAVLIDMEKGYSIS